MAVSTWKCSKINYRRKVIIIAKTTSSCFNLAVPSFTKLDPEKLKGLVCGAQNNEQAAIDELCRLFTPLINSEAKRQTVFNAFGEDSVNIAWVIFLSFIKRYNGKDYAHLPGLLQCHLRYELLHHIERESSLWNNEVNSEEALENQSYDAIEENFTNLSVKEALKALRPMQYKILEEYYVQQNSHRKIAKWFGYSERHIKRLKLEALKNIRKHLDD